METGPQLLDLIHRKPALIWGGGPYPFTSLIAFLMGYQNGFCENRRDKREREIGIHPEELLPAGFCRFVTEWFGEEFPAGGKGWQSFIRENSSSEQEAFDLFFKLRAEYDQANIAQQAAAHESPPPVSSLGAQAHLALDLPPAPVADNGQLAPVLGDSARMITVVALIDVHVQPSKIQVWIVPGSTVDHGDGGEFEGVFITDYLDARGICAGHCYDSEMADHLIERIKRKFEKVGTKVEVETTAND
jgi:hypothetical protein